MNYKHLTGIAGLLSLFLMTPVAQAQSDGNVYWRIDPSVKSCSMNISPSLTQDQWHRFTREIGAIASYKSLASAQTLGKGNVNLVLNGGYTPVDQHNPAWINTFVHPDEDCPLGDAIELPTLQARVGLTDKVDVGGYWINAFDANYGLVGGEVKYAFLSESRKRPAMAVRGSFSLLTGVPDFNVQLIGYDLIASKNVSVVTPYVGFRENLVIGTETTSKVDLDREVLGVSQGYFGVEYRVWSISLAAEYNISTVNTSAVALGFNL